MKTLLAIYFLICLPLLVLGQIQFSNLHLDEGIRIAKAEEKLIFVDVYTTWCGPCKILDRTTFQDSSLGTQMNQSFVNLKWNAEDEKYIDLAGRYQVVAYPTMLFIDQEGNLVKRVTGIKSSSELMEISNSVLRFLYESKFDLKDLDFEKMKLDDLASVLLDVQGMHSEEKKTAFNVFRSKIELVSDWEPYRDILMDNVDSSCDLLFLQSVIDLIPQVDQYDMSAILKLLNDVGPLFTVLEEKLSQTKLDENISKYQRVARMRMELKSKISPSERTEQEKEYKVSMLDYYKDHEYKEEYAALSDTLISEFIMNLDPDAVRRKDEWSMKFGRKIMDFGENDEEEDSSFEEMHLNPNPDMIIQAKLDSFIMNNPSSQRLSDRLNEICEVYVDFYSKKEQLKKIYEWSEKSLLFMPTPENHLFYAKIFTKIGDEEEAKINVLKGMASKYLTSSIEDEFKALKSSLK